MPEKPENRPKNGTEPVGCSLWLPREFRKRAPGYTQKISRNQHLMSFWVDDLTTNLARESDFFSYALGNDSLTALPGVSEDTGITVVMKKARNTNSDRPLQNWYQQVNEYLEENLWREGRGAAKTYARCAGSRCFNTTCQCPGRKCEGPLEWRCVDQGCLGELMFCMRCMVATYTQHPTHSVEKWNGAHFVRKRTWLQELGLQMLNCLGKLTAYDFLRGLEMCTNHNGLDKPPDCRKPFMHIVRQWREVKRQKRAKCGHFADGVRGTKQGELALACPQVGWNLPEGWENAPPAYRLSNRSVSSEAMDPILGDECGYFVKRYGEDGYNAHIGKHMNEEEISNCSGFKAMFQANAKRTKGLHTTGVGGVTCSQHNMWRANRLGDLQCGERRTPILQCNMDYILLATLIAFRLLWLIISYNIACQYSINFWTRMSGLPERMRLTIPPANVWCRFPTSVVNHFIRYRMPIFDQFLDADVWVTGTNAPDNPTGKRLVEGAGKLHGETIEQNWAFSNGAAGSTRLMGPGSRQATLEDIFGFHNYDWLLAMHRVFPKRLAVAMIEGAAHKIMLEAFTKGLEEANPAQLKEWRGLGRSRRSRRMWKLAIAKEELMRTETGDEVERDHSAGTFISMGLEIEEAQRKLTVDVCALKDLTGTQMLGLTKRCTALLKHIHKFRQIQNMYMPALRSVLSASQKQMYDGESEQAAEATRLFMPSEIKNGHLRARVCTVGVPDIEARMREGETSEVLEDVRGGLRTCTMANRYKLRNYTGQGLLTRGQNILRTISLRIHSAKIRYRYACAALLALRGHGQWEERLRVLADGDSLLDLVLSGHVSGSRVTQQPLARSSRYDEEVRLLREEMRRTITYGEAAAREWERLLTQELPGASPELTEGRRAYAAEHAATEHARCANLEIRWHGILAKADAYVNGDVAAAGMESVTVEVHLEDELDPEEEEARLEGEEED
ncbi:hypothetical protein K438DRAFT_1768842 [Mycena galopus ATCC 62051]|nr:hypothetical protein K438DRAFT_1768842 [Mycena galopus ATCC 62051]